MRKTVLMPVEKVLCDAHLARDKSEEEATDVISLAGRAWDLCMEHSLSFSRYLVDALGVPVAPDTTPAPVEPSPVLVPEEEDQEEATEEDQEEELAEAETEPRPSVMITGEIPKYTWDDARDAVRNLGYEVVGRADETTVLLICGDGAERATTKLRDARERGIPAFDATRPGAFRDAVCAGEFKGGDPLPEAVRKDAQAVISDRERNRMIRVWAKANGWNLPAKGRIPMGVSHAYRAATREQDTTPQESHSAA
ncbi:Lsr2 family protein [Kitasatospora sp. NBC_00070]|uniref:Lsr2 family DNA-binding protein n=1 Tax=Kitasatospora sp. NBC_00070 TaxID=2975962 RepID=UPI003249DFE6